MAFELMVQLLLPAPQGPLTLQPATAPQPPPATLLSALLPWPPPTPLQPAPRLPPTPLPPPLLPLPAPPLISSPLRPLAPLPLPPVLLPVLTLPALPAPSMPAMPQHVQRQSSFVFIVMPWAPGAACAAAASSAEAISAQPAQLQPASPRRYPEPGLELAFEPATTPASKLRRGVPQWVLPLVGDVDTGPMAAGPVFLALPVGGSQRVKPTGDEALVVAAPHLVTSSPSMLIGM